jgi:cystathionine beta-lyase
MAFNFDEPVERRGSESLKWDSVGKDMLPMFVADMDFKSSPAVLEALGKKISHGVFGYGHDPELPGVIKSWFREEYGLEVEEDWIILLPAIVPVLAAVARLREGRVLINTPNYHILLAAPARAGKESILSPLKNTDEYYEMDFEDLRRRAEDDVRLFYLCNPHNPVGRVYTREELLELSRFAKERNLVVISDEAHCGLVYDRPHIPFFSVDDYAAEKSVTIMGPGKTYNLAGLPFAFAVIPSANLRRDFRSACYSLPGPGILECAAAKAAYGSSAGWKRELTAYLRGNRDYFEKALGEKFPALRLTRVEGTYLQWADFRPLGIADPFRWFQEKAKILPNDGGIFGPQGAGYVRLHFGAPRSRLEEAVRRIEAGLRG